MGLDTTSQHAETAGARGKLFAWLRVNGPAPRTAIRRAGFSWETIATLLDDLMRAGHVDAHPGRRKDSLVYFVPKNAGDGSWDGDGS